MRDHGSRFGLVRLGPHDHIGWIFAGPREFAELAEPFLAEGAARNELLMYVAEDPDTSSFGNWTKSLPPGTLTGATIADVYGASGIVDATRQRATFARVLTEALAAGYTGIRVAADNTPLVLDKERIKAWIRWEIVADHFMSQNPVTGLCAFNKTKVDVSTLQQLATIHPVWSADADQPPFRLFSSDDALWLEGDVNSFALQQAQLALENLPPATGVVVDLTSTEAVSNDAFSTLRQLCDAGVAVTVRGASEIVRRLAHSAGVAEQTVAWVDVPGS